MHVTSTIFRIGLLYTFTVREGGPICETNYLLELKVREWGGGILYSRKYWQELNLAVEPRIAIARILADLNLVVRYGIGIRIYTSRKFWRILIWRL